MNSTPRWRIVLALLILAGMIFLLAEFTPIYIHNMRLQSFVSDITQNVDNQHKSDDVLRTWVAEKARTLGLPITEDNVHVSHPRDGIRIDVRYAVRVDLPAYTVNLHFNPGAGSQ